MRSALFATTLILLPLLAVAGDIHRWRDENGRISFGDKPPANVATEVVEVKPNVYASPTIETLAEPLVKEAPVVLYSAVWCGYCKQARNYFKAKAIPFVEYDVEKSDRGRRDYKRLRARGVPVILVGKQRLNGFDAASFERIYSGA